MTTDAAGRRVLAKVAGTADEAMRLEREARNLDAARHPGVVELVGVDGHGIGAILLTAHVDGPTLAGVGRLPLEEGAGLLAALATTVADLHDLGVVHGAVSPEHVLLGPGGRPVLCSLGYGGSAEEMSPADDVAALGALARFVAPDPPCGHVLAKVADLATDDPSARPTARAVAEMLQQQVPAARLPRGLPAPPPGRPAAGPVDPLAAWRRERGVLRARRRPARSLALAGVGAVVVVVLGGAALLLSRSPATTSPEPVTELAEPPPPDEAQPDPPTTRAGLSSSTTTTTARATAVRADCPPATGVLQADVDGDGCPDGLRYADGILQAGDIRWSLGQPGDQVATGDWSCRGTRTLALYRPSTGDIFRFDGWAGPGTDVTATAVGRVPGGSALRAADVDRDGCHEAVVERGTGAPEVVRLAPVRR